MAEVDTQRVAIHEAGHAVVAVVLGITVLEVHIRSDGENHGTTTIRLRSDEEGKATQARFQAGKLNAADRELEAREIVQTFAGPQAELLLGGGKPRGGHGDDLTIMGKLKALFPRGDWVRTYGSLRGIADELVWRYEGAIRAVAGELLKQEMISGERIHELAAQHGVVVRTPEELVLPHS